MDHSVDKAIEERVIKEASRLIVGNKKATIDSTLLSLNFDSLNEVELVMGIEHEFEIPIPDDIANKFKTIKQIVDYLTLHKDMIS